MSKVRTESVAMCEECERVPVSVYLAPSGRHRGLRICARCLGEEGVHLEDEDPVSLAHEAALDTPKSEN